MVDRPIHESGDLALRDAVLKTFTEDHALRDFKLRVGVSNGYAHLGGSLPSIEMRTRAAQLCLRVQGVRAVVNRITAPGAPNPARAAQLEMYDTNAYPYTRERDS
jgi:hypothetical protein